MDRELKQIKLEHKFSKQHVRALLRGECEKAIDKRLVFTFKQGLAAIKDWLSKPKSLDLQTAVDYFDSDEKIEKFMVEMIMAVYVNNDYVQIQAMAGEVKCGALTIFDG